MDSHELWLLATQAMGKETQVVETRKHQDGCNLETSEVSIQVLHPHYRTIESTYYVDPGTDEKGYRARTLEHLAAMVRGRKAWIDASPGLGSRKREG